MNLYFINYYYFFIYHHTKVPKKVGKIVSLKPKFEKIL